MPKASNDIGLLTSVEDALHSIRSALLESEHLARSDLDTLISVAQSEVKRELERRRQASQPGDDLQQGQDFSQ